MAPPSIPSIAPYAQQHKVTKGPGDERPTAFQVLADQSAFGAHASHTILVTGTTSGLGKETARALHATGAKVFITAREQAKGDEVARDLEASNAADAAIPAAAKGKLQPISAVAMDLGSLASVRSGAAAFLKQSGGKLNILVCNAGVMATPEGKTVDGFETQFGTCHVGHFQLFESVKDALLAGAASSPSFASRVVAVSSSGHRISPVKVGNYDFSDPSDGYEAWKAYGQAKCANVWFANGLDKRFSAQRVHGLSLHPGGINTNLGRHLEPGALDAVLGDMETFGKSTKSIEQGAATQVWAATAKELEGLGGLFLDDVSVAGEYKEGDPIYGPGYAEWAYDEAGADRLWKDSEQMIAAVS